MSGNCFIEVRAIGAKVLNSRVSNLPSPTASERMTLAVIRSRPAFMIPSRSDFSFLKTLSASSTRSETPYSSTTRNSEDGVIEEAMRAS